MAARLKAWAKRLKRQVFVLYYAYRDERAPWLAKLVSACVVAYAFSPVDLIPDFIPVPGYLDDVILIPLGVMLALRMMPDPVLEAARTKADERLAAGKRKPKNWFAGLLVVLAWLAAACGIALWLFYRLMGG
ncbi:DUF1232 domain-containing protein [Paenibacillus sp. MWE-103]|uniref:DUF1232 domain-containing protein n=1 Tax=Paenibacillus artemisiicola TaxID=1172618 RepID=A0ABS3W3J5_9BACL|nr:DUF1232 domain-containing protein [Paenibacillus artemisiicola]